MLIPLLVLVTVCHMTAAQIPRVTKSIKTINIYQRNYSQIYVSTNEEAFYVYVCFEGFWNVSEPNTCLRLDTSLEESYNTITLDTAQPSLTLKMNGDQQRTLVLSFSNDVVYGTVSPSSNYVSKGVMLYVGDMVEEADSMFVLNRKSMGLKGCNTDEVKVGVGLYGCYPDGRLVTCSISEQLMFLPCFLCKKRKCEAVQLCSVTGDSVNTFDGRTLTIPDRCAYQLVGNSTYRNLDIKAFFGERRRNDVPLLDRVEITFDNNFIEVGQRELKMDNVPLDLTTPYSSMGDIISRTSTGFYIKMSGILMHFDGDSFVIARSSLNGFKNGLCVSGDTSTPLNKHVNEQGCDMVHNEKNDTTIDCGEIKQHCSFLNSSAFSSCPISLDRAVMTQMCEDLLCRYPSVDTARCMFHEALAATCDLLEKPVTDWKNQTQCVSGTTAGKCMDPMCADHEFCGLEKGEETCLCRAIFSSRHRADNTFGEPTVCSENSASLSLALCLLKEKNIHYDELRLNDPNCTGQVDQDLVGMVTFGFSNTNMCGTEVTVKDNKVLHSNKVLLSNHSTGLITRHDQFELDFSCFYNAPQVQTVGLKIKDSSVVTVITAGDWSYNLSIVAYEDEGRTKALAAGADITLDQSVWVELKAEGLDQDLVALVTDNCWATNEADSNATLKYDLVKAGCPNAADQSVSVHQNGVGTSNYFSFNTFKFSGSSSSDLYLHCEVSLCVEKKCAPSCIGARRRRSLRRDRALVSMFWAE